MKQVVVTQLPYLGFDTERIWEQLTRESSAGDRNKRKIVMSRLRDAQEEQNGAKLTKRQESRGNTKTGDKKTAWEIRFQRFEATNPQPTDRRRQHIHAGSKTRSTKHGDFAAYASAPSPAPAFPCGFVSDQKDPQCGGFDPRLSNKKALHHFLRAPYPSKFSPPYPLPNSANFRRPPSFRRRKA